MNYLWPIICCLGIVIFASSLQAQTEIDALRFSQTTSLGTARSLGMAGATSAMGADLSAATLNPAGLGLYRRSDLVFTPALRNIKSNASFLDGGGSATTSNFGFSNFGLAISEKVYTGYGRERKPAEKGFKSFTIAFGFNQLENFYRETDATGYNPHSSITDRYAELANGLQPSELDPNSFGGLAWDIFAIDVEEIPTFDRYFGAGVGGNLNQRYRLTESGRRNEWFVSGGANIDDFLFLGLGLGIQSVRYEQRFRYEETDVNDLHQNYVFDINNPLGLPLEFPFNSLTQEERLETRGGGVNAKLGVIVRPNDNLRIGVGVQTPTSISLSDQYNLAMDNNHNLDINLLQVRDRDTTMSVSTETSQSEYVVKTPYRINIGAMYLFGKRGFVTTDIEVVDYSAASMKSGYIESDPAFYDYAFENDQIKDLFKMGINLRVGGEARLGIARARAGFALFGAGLDAEARQYEDLDNLGEVLTFDPKRQLLTLGLGLRQPNYYIDVAYISQQTKEKSSPYTTEDAELFDPVLINTLTSTSFALSVGFLF